MSIALALSLVHAGAKGNTRSQIASAICKGANDDQLKKHYSFLASAIVKPKNGVEVNLANKAFIDKNFTIKDSYLKAISYAYKASAQNIDISDPAEAAEVMNEFVKTATKGKIEEIIDKDNISPDAVMFLINALYLKADWKEEFKQSATRDRKFYIKEGVSKSIPFMSVKAKNRDYASDDQVQVLSLPYKDTDYRFNIFLPKEKFGLEKVVKGLTAEKVQGLLGKLEDTLLNIEIPKMKLEKELNLKETLENIGLEDMFGNEADFGEISAAQLKVDEKGTTAAAATFVEIVLRSMMVPSHDPIDFVADHPFLFALTYKNHPLFIGVFSN
ncbi:hypothetical protein WR25_02310 isoform B [Diploscapter pachys]|uniref:Serpin domain-containing protein n=1 Tax=Diploscapter pachys TaxID=2018661 RepID=A0A2A2J7E9_9BILA|nr:hypothetical protein WR25_02310 isoform A [Diploscapter pachys]PAV57561.1 hypothetical protein WR25_02310 isoform B [Diploscapter pachys]